MDLVRNQNTDIFEPCQFTQLYAIILWGTSVLAFNLILNIDQLFSFKYRAVLSCLRTQLPTGTAFVFLSFCHFFVFIYSSSFPSLGTLLKGGAKSHFFFPFLLSQKKAYIATNHQMSEESFLKNITAFEWRSYILFSTIIQIFF